MPSSLAASLRRLSSRALGRLTSGAFVQHVLTLGTGAVAGHLIALLASPVITRLYTPAEFGAAGIFLSILGVHTDAADSGYPRAITLPRDRDMANSVFFAALASAPVWGMIVWAEVIALGPELVGWTNTPELGPILWLLPLAVMAESAFLAFWYWSIRLRSYDHAADAKFTVGSSRAAGAVALGSGGTGSVGLVLAEMIARLAGTVRLAVQSWRSTGSRWESTSWRAIAGAVDRYRRFPSLSAPAAVLQSLQLATPVVALAFLFGPIEAGFFTLIWRGVYSPFSVLSQTVAQVFFGEASVHVRKTGRDVGSLFRRVSWRLFLIMVGPLTALAVVAPTLFRWVFGEPWTTAGEYFQIAMPAFLAMLVVIPVSQMLNILERQRLLVLVEAVGLTLVTGAFVASHLLGLTPRFTLAAWSAAMVTSYGLMFVAALMATDSHTVP